MFQEVLSINKNYAIVKISNNTFDDIINLYVLENLSSINIIVV